MTHAALSLLRGDILGSLRYQAFLIPYIATIVANITTLDFLALGFLRTGRWLWTLLITSVGYYAVRMVLFFPDGPYPMAYDPRCYLYKVFRAICAAMG